ncbi:MAG: S9 family peptidase [Pirellulaceae bacterium]
MKYKLFAVALILFASNGAFSQQDFIDKLSLESIYGDKATSAKAFNAAWATEGHSYAVQEDSAEQPADGDGSDGAKDIVWLDAVTGDKEILVKSSQLIPAGSEVPLSVYSYEFSADRSLVLIYTNTKRVWRQNTRGDYWVLDLTAHTLQKVGKDRPESSLMFAKFSPNGKSLAYVYDRNIYVEDIKSQAVVPITNADDPHIINGTSDWVNEEELSIRDGFRWSPDGSQIAYWQFDTTGVPEMTMIDNTADRYPKLITFTYPKAGQQNSSCRIGVATLATGETSWVSLAGDPREHYVARIEWAPKHEGRSAELILQQLNRLQNTNRVLSWNSATHQTREIFVERDEAWVDVHDEMFWLADGRHFTWASERDGWRRIYLVDSRTGARNPVTPTNVDAIELVAIDDSSELAYVIASPENATQRYLYHVNLDGSGWQRLSPTSQPGTHAYRFSADKKFAVHTWSSLTRVPTIDLISLPDHQTIRVLEGNEKLAEHIAKHCTARASFQKVEIEEGVQLDSWVIQPAAMEPGKKYPLLIYVYGEPAGTTVVDQWMGSSYEWYQMLAQQGYVVMSFDNRGTPAPKGREWRKSIYGKIGINASIDQAAAVRKVLAGNSDLDPARVGVWGWSGGGSMTLNAMFRYPDLYSTGISIAPVPDQLGYDTIYQERYMGLPSDNPNGYQDGSPIHMCAQLTGKLLLIHGTGDDNCHYATMEQLIDKLIEHNKQFDMLLYPNRTHAIREGKNTTLHLRTLMTNYLHANLPPGPRD